MKVDVHEGEMNLQGSTEVHWRKVHTTGHSRKVHKTVGYDDNYSPGCNRGLDIMELLCHSS